MPRRHSVCQRAPHQSVPHRPGSHQLLLHGPRRLLRRPGPLRQHPLPDRHRRYHRLARCCSSASFRSPKAAPVRHLLERDGAPTHKHVDLEPALSSSPRAHSSRSWGGNRNYLQDLLCWWACGAVASVVSPSTWALQRAARSLSARWRMCFAGGMIAFSQPMLCGMKRFDCKRMLTRRKKSSSSRRMQS